MCKIHRISPVRPSVLCPRDVRLHGVVPRANVTVHLVVAAHALVVVVAAVALATGRTCRIGNETIAISAHAAVMGAPCFGDVIPMARTLRRP